MDKTQALSILCDQHEQLGVEVASKIKGNRAFVSIGAYKNRVIGEPIPDGALTYYFLMQCELKEHLLNYDVSEK